MNSAPGPPSPERRRRWIGMLFVTPLVGVLAAALLHPYPRQHVFGPRVRGEPVWYWQQHIRQQGDPQAHRAALFSRIMDFLGFDPLVGTAVAIPWDDPDLLPFLCELLEDPNPAVRGYVAHQLIRGQGTPEDAVSLTKLLDDPAPAVRLAALSALAPQHPQAESALPVLRTKLDDPDPFCRLMAASLVWRMTQNADETLPIFRQGMQDPQSAVRLFALGALARMGTAAEPALSEIAACARHDAESFVCETAINTLGRIGPKALPFLLPLLHDSGSHRCTIAIRSMQQLGPQARAAVPELCRLLADPACGHVHDEVRQALSAIAPEEFPALPENEEPGAGDRIIMERG